MRTPVLRSKECSTFSKFGLHQNTTFWITFELSDTKTAK